MMVKCPECDADISSMANPCPQCGFPCAGYKSKQFMELALLSVQKDPIGYYRNRYLNHFSDGEPKCPNYKTGFFTKIHNVAVKSCYLEKIENEYFICIDFTCNTCGKFWKHTFY